MYFGHSSSIAFCVCVVCDTGQFGPVYRAERITDNASVPVALKPIKSRISSEEDITIFLREMAVLKCVRHPNVVQVYGLVDDGK